MRERFDDMPERIRALPVDRRGYPVPKFVEWIDGEPDFRVMRRDHVHRCVRQHRCWICGEQLGRHFVFVIGPMCCINRISAEPPSHRDCAEFAAKACPFLSIPTAKRPDRPVGGGIEVKDAPGVMVKHNPGVACLWKTPNYRMVKVYNGALIEIGEPVDISFWAQGRLATRGEVEAAVGKGLPLLRQAAAGEGPQAVAALERQKATFDRLLERVMPA